jgi:phage-related protein
MADFYWQAIVGSKKTVEARVRRANFGDGYEQRVQDGINNTKFRWDISTAPVDKTTANSIESFLIAKGGYLSFTWNAEDDGDVTVIATAWSKTPISRDLWQITTTFEQVYEL